MPFHTQCRSIADCVLPCRPQYGKPYTSRRFAKPLALPIQTAVVTLEVLPIAQVSLALSVVPVLPNS